MTKIDSRLQTRLQLLPPANRLNLVYETLDELHSAICEGNAELPAEFENPAALMDWLREVIYTAQETIRELEQQPPASSALPAIPRRRPKLIVLDKAT